jgi:hypothetical protein
MSCSIKGASNQDMNSYSESYTNQEKIMGSQNNGGEYSSSS